MLPVVMMVVVVVEGGGQRLVYRLVTRVRNYMVTVAVELLRDRHHARSTHSGWMLFRLLR